MASFNRRLCIVLLLVINFMCFPVILEMIQTIFLTFHMQFLFFFSSFRWKEVLWSRNKIEYASKCSLIACKEKLFNALQTVLL